MILYDLPNSAQNYKRKAISIFHEKSKPILAHADHMAQRVRAREHGAAHRRGVAHAWRRPTVRRSTCAGTYAKTPLDYEQNNPQSTLLFLETALMQKNPRTFLLFTTVRPLAIPACFDVVSCGTGIYVGHTGPR